MGVACGRVSMSDLIDVRGVSSSRGNTEISRPAGALPASETPARSSLKQQSGTIAGQEPRDQLTRVPGATKPPAAVGPVELPPSATHAVTDAVERLERTIDWAAERVEFTH